MIHSSEVDLLRSAAGQYPATQFIQDPLHALSGGGNEIQAPPANGSSEVNLSDASKLLGLLDAESGGSDSLLSALSDLVEKLVGQKVSSLSLDSQKLDTSSFSLDTVYERLRLGAGASPVDYRYSAIHAEAQTLSYSAQGTLKLEDGTELSFNFQVEASRVYVEETRARVRIDGSRFQDMLGTNIPGISVRSRENGADIALDHQGVRQLLEALKDAQPGQGRRHAYGHDLRGGVVENAAHQGQGVKQHAADVSA